MTKFKAGDRIKYIGDKTMGTSPSWPDSDIGKIGTITAIEDGEVIKIYMPGSDCPCGKTWTTTRWRVKLLDRQLLLWDDVYDV